MVRPVSSNGIPECHAHIGSFLQKVLFCTEPDYTFGDHQCSDVSVAPWRIPLRTPLVRGTLGPEGDYEDEYGV